MNKQAKATSFPSCCYRDVNLREINSSLNVRLVNKSSCTCRSRNLKTRKKLLVMEKTHFWL